MATSYETGISAHARSSVKDEWRKGWRVVASAFVGNGLGFNLFLMSAGLFIIPLQEELGLPRTAVMISTVAMLLVSLLTPVAAVYIDKYGPRTGAILGYLVLIAAYALLALLPATPIVYYAVAGLFVIAGTVTGTMTFCKGISLIFHKGAGFAFGITMSGVSLVSAVVIPVLSAAIVAYGWRAGYGLSGVLVALIGLPVLLLAFSPPVQPAVEKLSPKTVEIAETRAWHVIKSSSFWILATAISCGTFCLGGLISHLYPMVIGAGVDTVLAATLLSTYAVSIGAGRIIVGILLDKSSPTFVAAACMSTTAAGAAILYFVIDGTFPDYVGFAAAFLLGWGHGAEGDFPAFFALRLFGRESFAKIFSWLNIFAGGFMAVGGLTYAAVYDWTGSYLSMIVLTALLWLCGGALMLCLRRQVQAI